MKRGILVLTAMNILVLVLGCAKKNYENMTVPELITVLKEEDNWGETRAFVALSGIGEQAVPTLIEALKDEDAAVRNIAAFALGNIGPVTKEAIPALVKALKDEKSWVRWNTHS